MTGGQRKTRNDRRAAAAPLTTEDQTATTPGFSREQLHDIQAHCTLAVLATVDGTGLPYTAVISWFFVQAADRVVLALDWRGQSFANTLAQPEVALELLGEDIVLSVKGRVRLVQPQLHAAPFGVAKIVVDVHAVRDQAVPGVHFTAPRYAYSPGKQHRIAVEQRVIKELAEPDPAVSPCLDPAHTSRAPHSEPPEAV